MYSEAIGKLLRRENLDASLARSVMSEIMDGALTPPQIAAFLTALTAKGETSDELAGLAGVMRERALRVDVDTEVLDTCGTGGSGLTTPNTSTIAAFVVAAGGVSVAKHGNRASSGQCGSMDVLEALDVPIDLDAREVASTIRELHLGFMFAPKFHPAMAHVAAVRRALGFRTTFNFLGPLANPARATLQVLGVSDLQRAPILAEALLKLGARRVLVVHGSDGLDEITLDGPTHALLLADGTLTHSQIEPATFGLQRVEAVQLRGGDAATNAGLFTAILEGREIGARAELVAVNAGAAFYVAGRVESPREGHQLAHQLLRSGAARALFVSYRARAKALVEAR